MAKPIRVLPLLPAPPYVRGSGCARGLWPLLCPCMVPCTAPASACSVQLAQDLRSPRACVRACSLAVAVHRVVALARTARRTDGAPRVGVRLELDGSALAFGALNSAWTHAAPDDGDAVRTDSAPTSGPEALKAPAGSTRTLAARCVVQIRCRGAGGWRRLTGRQAPIVYQLRRAHGRGWCSPRRW